MLHQLAKNGHASRARASGVFRFLPSPFTSMPYLLIDRWLQVKAKTIFAFTLCDLRFLTQRGREKSNENAEKQWTLIKNVPTFVPKPTTIQATPAQRWRQRWTQTFTFSFTTSIWFTATYTRRWRVKAKNEKLRCAHALPRARKCTFRQHPTVFREILLSGKSLDAANLSFWPPLNRLIHLTSSKVPLFLFFASVFLADSRCIRWSDPRKSIEFAIL